jgi:hypothetical protein
MWQCGQCSIPDATVRRHNEQVTSGTPSYYPRFRRRGGAAFRRRRFIASALALSH